MYGSYSASAAASAGAAAAFFGILFFIVGIVMLIAWLMAVSKLVELAKDKGHFKDGTGMLWFMGIFASPIVLGIYVIALPDLHAKKQLEQKPQAAAAELANQ